MAIYDVSVPVSNEMPVWPGDPPVKLERRDHLAASGNYTVRLTAIEMGSHTGTHIDAPWHFLDSGRKLHEIPLSTLNGPALVVQIDGVRSIARHHLAGLNLEDIERILFKTDNSTHWHDGAFYRDYVYMEPEAAEYLLEQGIGLVGIDYLSIDKFKAGNHPVHFILLSNNVVILEGLDLSGVVPGTYHMAALPLNLHDADGAPARVILMDDR